MKKTKYLCLMLGVLIFASCQKAADNSAAAVASKTSIKNISVDEAHAAVKSNDVQFIDVRTVEEYEGEHALKAVNFPLDSLERNLNELDKNKPVYLICQTGRRSQKGAEILEKAGFTALFNIEGGTGAWTAAKLPTEKASGN